MCRARRSSFADLGVVGARDVLGQDGDVVDDQSATGVADRLELGGEALLADWCDGLGGDPVDDPGDCREDDSAADQEGDEDVESAPVDSFIHAKRLADGGRVSRSTVSDVGSTATQALEPVEFAQHQAGREADFGDRGR